MSNSTKNIIATIMANSAEENMAKLILDIKKKRKEIGISNSDVRNGKVAEIDAALTKSEIYKKIRSALKNKKPTFYFIEKAGDKTVIFLKKGDKEMKRYEIEGDFAIPAATAAVAGLSGMDENIQKIVDILSILYSRIKNERINALSAKDFINKYATVLIQFINDCTPGINLKTYLDDELGDHTPEDRFYESIRANNSFFDIITILEEVVVETQNQNCTMAGGSKKKKKGGAVSASDILKRIQKEMEKGPSLAIQRIESNVNPKIKKIVNMLKKTTPARLNILTELPNNTHKTVQGRYNVFKTFLDQYITRIDRSDVTSINTTLNTPPTGANGIHYIDFDFGEEKVSSNVEKNVKLIIDDDINLFNRVLREFIKKSKKSTNGKSSNTELIQFVGKYKSELKKFIDDNSIKTATSFTAVQFTNEAALQTVVAGFNGTQYRLYQFYKVVYEYVFRAHYQTLSADYPFQLPQEISCRNRVVSFIWYKLQIIMTRAVNGPIDVGTSARGITNSVFTDELVVKYLHRYYREKVRNAKNDATKVDMTVLQIEDSPDSFYHAVFASLYSRNNETNTFTNFLEYIGGNPDNFPTAPATAAGNTGLGAAAVPNAGVGFPVNTTRAALALFSNQRNALQVLISNGVNTMGTSRTINTDAAVAAINVPAGMSVVDYNYSIRDRINDSASNKTFAQVLDFLDLSITASDKAMKQINNNAHDAYSSYVKWFINNLRNIIGTRITTSDVFNDDLKELIKKIRDMLRKNVSKPSRNMNRNLATHSSLSKYQNTFFSKVFKSINDLPTDQQLENPTFLNALKTRIGESIKQNTTKACDLEFLILNTLIQSTVCNTGFFDLSNIKSVSKKGELNTYILMANQVFKQKAVLNVPTGLQDCILIQSDDLFHFNAVVRRVFEGTSKERCERMQGIGTETIIGYDNLVVAQVAFYALKGVTTPVNHTAADLTEFYRKVIGATSTTNVAGIAEGTIDTGILNGVKALDVIKKKRAECTLSGQFVYDPLPAPSAVTRNLVSDLRTHIETSQVALADFFNTGANNQIQAAVMAVGFAGALTTPIVAPVRFSIV